MIDVVQAGRAAMVSAKTWGKSAGFRETWRRILPNFRVDDKRRATVYSVGMIRSFRHKGLEAFFHSGSKAGIQPDHAAKLRVLLTALDAAEGAEQMNAPGWRLHRLTGDYEGCWSVRVNGNWRVIFRFEGIHAEMVDYVDHH